MSKDYNKELLNFLEKSPTAFHGVQNICFTLEDKGYQKLEEGEKWKLEPQKGYFVTRNDSSVIAFKIPKKSFGGYQIVASHSDSPCFKIKEKPELLRGKRYTSLNVEGYGGMLMAPWFDRPLSVAGRIMVKDGNKIRSLLVNIEEDLLMIPNLAIHMNREANNGYAYNVQKDLIPLMGDGSQEGKLMERVAKKAGVEAENILGKDLFVYNRQPGTVWGLEKEYIGAPRIDNLMCAYGSLQGFLQGRGKENVNVYCVFDNEEVGSQTKQGAGSSFLEDVLCRINLSLGREKEEYFTALANSFMVSADNAHGVHPNIPEKSDEVNRVYMNEGIVIKHSANQKYTTDGVSRGIFVDICKKAGVPVQDFVNPSNVVGGSTLGNIANTKTSVNTVDIGLAQLAMHSPYECAGAKDIEYMIKGMKAFFSTTIRTIGSGSYEL